MEVVQPPDRRHKEWLARWDLYGLGHLLVISCSTVFTFGLKQWV